VALPWGTLLGQPLSLFGALAYGLVVVLALLPVLPIGKTAQASEKLTASLLVPLTTGMCPHCHDQKELFGRQATAKLSGYKGPRDF
jgi:uncharacterized membrane protein